MTGPAPFRKGRTVSVVAVVFAILAALLHLLFFAMESILWTRPQVWHRFWIASQRDAELTKPLAYNQGFYNLFLTAGIVVGLLLLGSHESAGRALVLFCCLSMCAAGLVLLSTGLDKLRSAAIQFVPPALAVIFALAS